MKTGISVADAMTQKPVTIKPSATLKQCAELMAKKRVGSLVVEQKGEFVGIITERDLVRKVLAKNVSSAKTKVKNIMEETILTVMPEQDIFEAVNLMRDADVRQLPVVQDGRLLGLVTVKDVMKIQPDLFEILIQKYELREERRKPTKW